MRSLWGGHMGLSPQGLGDWALGTLNEVCFWKFRLSFSPFSASLGLCPEDCDSLSLFCSVIKQGSPIWDT